MDPKDPRRRLTGPLDPQSIGSSLPRPGGGSRTPPAEVHRYVVLPRDIKRRSFNIVELRPWRFTIAAPGLTGQLVAFELHGDTLIGTNAEDDPELDINLNYLDGWNRGVSRRHLLLRPTRTLLLVQDLRSTNGTKLNGHTYRPGWVYAMKDGDVLSLGRLHLRFSIVQRPEAAG